MAELVIGPEDALYYQHHAPDGRARSFVFVNALTGSAGMWEAEIGPALRGMGYGTLAYDFRGQGNSRFSDRGALGPAAIVDDLCRLMAAVAPPGPILVGLSIGGLFAARAHLAGAGAAGLVLINTLRRPGLRLDWLSEAAKRAAAIGGTRLLMDMYLPMLVNADRLESMRGAALTDQPYAPLAADTGTHGLMAHAGEADWDLPYERLDVPVLIVSGLMDRMFFDAADVADLAARIPDSRMVEMADAGHLIPVERPRETVAALAEFAAGL